MSWLNNIVKSNSNSKEVKVSTDFDGKEEDGCFEGMSCSDLQKIVAVFAVLSEWRQACITNGCSAGKFYAITGNESNMTITRQHIGPFL